MDFGAAKPYPAYLREHSPDYGAYRIKPRSSEDTSALPAFRPASELPREPASTTAPREVTHENVETTASPESGRAWASGQLVFNAGQFESARSGFADCARDGETAKELRARVNCAILDDLKERSLALRALPAKLHDRDPDSAVVSRKHMHPALGVRIRNVGGGI